MQEMQAPSGEVVREFVAGKRVAVDAVLDQRRAELEAQGYKFLVRRKIGANEICPCKSGRKFKHCCVRLVVRAAGGTFLKPEAAAAIKQHRAQRQDER